MDRKSIGTVGRPQPSPRVARRRREDRNDKEGRRRRWQEAVEQCQGGRPGGTPARSLAQPVFSRTPAGLPPLQLMLEQVAGETSAPQALSDDQKSMLLRFRRDLREAFARLGLDRLSSSAALEHTVNAAVARLSAEPAASVDVMAAVYRLADRMKDPHAVQALSRHDDTDDEEIDPSGMAFR